MIRLRLWVNISLILIGILTLSLITSNLRNTGFFIRTSSSLNDFAINQKFFSLSTAFNIDDIEKSWAGRLGLMEMRHSDVAIIGAGKNVAEHLPSVLKQIEILGSLFHTSRAVFVEGDSTDNTKDILEKWTAQSPQNRSLFVLRNQMAEFEKSGYFAGLPLPREGRIGDARNVALDYIHTLPPTKYVIVVDLDQIGWDMSGVVDSFSRRNWDVICAHGTLLHGLYRDEYAFRRKDVNTNHHRCGDDFEMYNLTLTQKAAYRQEVNVAKRRVQKIMADAVKVAYNARINGRYDSTTFTGLRKANETRFFSLTENHDHVDPLLVPVDSCFGGLSIYKAAALNGCKYSYRHAEIPYFQDCEHVLLHECMRTRNNARIFSNPFMKLWYGHNPITTENIKKEYSKLKLFRAN